MFVVERTQAGEFGVDNPQLVVLSLVRCFILSPGHLVDVDITGHVDVAGNVAGVMFVRPVQFVAYLGHVLIKPHLNLH